VDKLPKWIGDIIKKSETYQQRITPAVAPVDNITQFVDLDDADGELPF
jgi:hypothetical protein